MEQGASLLIKGEIFAGEDVTITGRVEGRIEAAGHAVTLAAGSLVIGDVEAGSIDVSGRVEGAVVASDCVRVGPEGEIEGDLQTARLAIADGGRVHGRVEMASPAPAAAA